MKKAKPISKQVRYQRRNKRLGLCRLCGRKRWGSRKLCRRHALEDRERARLNYAAAKLKRKKR
jgi:hypothetical protein